MKKIKSRLFFTLCFLVLIFSYSCENDQQNNDCETCKTENHISSKVNFYGNSFNSKKYKNSELNLNFYHTNTTINEKLYTFIDDIDIKKVIDLNDGEIVAINLITNRLNPSSNYEEYNLNKNNILGLILYLKNNNNIVLKFFKYIDNELQEQSFSNYKLSTITSNQIFKITDLFFENLEKDVFLFVDNSYRSVEDYNNKEINRELEILYYSRNEYNRIGPETCGSPCTANNGSECGLNNAEEWFCRKDENCPKDDQEEELTPPERLNYNLMGITNDLYDFRNNYLKSYNGGQKIIDDYYDLGQTLSLSYHTLEQARVTFNLLSSDIIPMINSLKNNPHGNTILINNQLKDKIVNYLQNIKIYYSDAASRNKIDNLIIKTNYFTNRTNSFITNNLHLY